MKNYCRIFILLVMLINIFGMPANVYADSGEIIPGDVVLFGESYTLQSGNVLDGNLVVFGGSIMVEEESNVEGDVVLIGGTIRVDGSVDGSVIGIGGSVILGDTAIVDGDVLAMASGLDRSEGAVVRGDLIGSVPGELNIVRPENLNLRPPVLPNVPQFVRPRFSMDFSPWSAIPMGILESLVWAALGALLVLFLQKPTERVASTLVSKPALSGGMGLLTVVLAPGVLILLAITILLIPLVPLAAIAVVFAGIFGWIAIGFEIGKRLAVIFRVRWAEPVSAGIGILVLTLVAKAIWAVPCIGWVVPFILAVMGLGAVVISRFGSRPPQFSGQTGVAELPPIPEGSAIILSTADEVITEARSDSDSVDPNLDEVVDVRVWDSDIESTPKESSGEEVESLETEDSVDEKISIESQSKPVRKRTAKRTPAVKAKTPDDVSKSSDTTQAEVQEAEKKPTRKRPARSSTKKEPLNKGESDSIADTE
jgi:cytoskeletal protein CcmA (bactofilin family)